ncbi:MAG TPA: PDZ domain-containing protein [Terriglobia bacterium]
MTGKKRVVAGLAIMIAAGLFLGRRSLRAQQKDSDDDQLVINTLIEPGNQSWLGVELKDITADQAREMKVGNDFGALVGEVEKDSPAARAGLQPGDVIVEFGGEKVRSVAELRRLVDETPPGRTVQIRVRRAGNSETLSATLEARKDATLPLVSKLRQEVWPRVNVPVYDFSFGFGAPRLGLTVDALTPQLGEYFGVQDGKGVLVREVKSGSAADKAGIKAGDCVVKLDSTPIDSANELHRALLRKQGESPGKSLDVTLTIVRDRKEQTLQVHLEPVSHPGPQVITESSSVGLPADEEFEAEAQALLPDAESLAASADEVRRQLESQRGEIDREAGAVKAQARRAADQARELQRQLLGQKDQWQQDLKQLGPEMKKFQQEMKEFQDQFGSDVI